MFVSGQDVMTDQTQKIRVFWDSSPTLPIIPVTSL
jgi:hypothetical protein